MKTAVLLILTLTTLWNLILHYLELRSAKNPMPENVKDIYDEETYTKWLSYHEEKTKFSIVRSLAGFMLSFLLLLFNVYALFDGEEFYTPAILLTIFDVVITLPITIPLDWHDTMVIEEKYGFNKSTKKTFFLDQVKSLLIDIGLSCGIVCAYIGVHQWLGDKMILVFAAGLVLFVLIFSFFSPFFLKIFNKFTPLEEGELREKLTALLERNGYSVREIKVMDASKRSTKSNAMFTGFGKTKTIILYDNLVNASTPDEICAVFAHEMGHGIHKDTLKLQLVNLVQILITATLAWLLARNPSMYKAFGFEHMNYGFAVLLMGIFLGILSPFMGLFMNAISRRAEYRADRQAVKEGYGKDLISALKKLSHDNFANLAPSRLLVLLEYSHPTTSQRIYAINAAEQEEELKKLFKEK